MNKTRVISILRAAAEIAALLVFAFLFLNHKLQMWIIFFGAAAVLSIFLGRYYCSWICPMNTAFRFIGWLYKKIGIKRIKTPRFLRSNVSRIILVLLFAGSMIVTKKMGLKIDMILYITAFAVFLTLIFEENMWHRHLCPFGTILSITSRKSKYRLNINEDGCISCGKCQIVCPSNSIITLDNKKRWNLKHECLLCGQCIDACPKSVCKFIF
ncbi:MAG: 4Fe-4S binding protein [Spirochaetales bacterium]|nr:4Fe-4S binding protein [Spirochaetales bacterium]